MRANLRHSGTAKRDWSFDWAAKVATVLPQDQTMRGSQVLIDRTLDKKVSLNAKLEPSFRL
jgi:hypothetical protein